MELYFLQRFCYNGKKAKGDGRMTQDVLMFFDKDPNMLPLYEALEQQILSRIENVQLRVQKTQIGFYNRHLFAAVSFLKVRKANQRPPHFITLTFGLNYRLDSSRIDAATEPYPGRWTHHLLLDNIEQIDDELMGWLLQAAAFSDSKR